MKFKTFNFDLNYFWKWQFFHYEIFFRFKNSLQLPGAGRTRVGHHHGSDMPPSPRAVYVLKSAKCNEIMPSVYKLFMPVRFLRGMMPDAGTKWGKLSNTTLVDLNLTTLFKVSTYFDALQIVGILCLPITVIFIKCDVWGVVLTWHS